MCIIYYSLEKTIKRAIHPLQCLWTETQVERRFDLKKTILYYRFSFTAYKQIANMEQ